MWIKSVIRLKENEKFVKLVLAKSKFPKFDREYFLRG